MDQNRIAVRRGGGTILVTGATGTVGSALLAELAGRDDVRALVRDPARLQAPAAQVAVAAFEDPTGLRRALRGVERVFLLSPPGGEDMAAAQLAVVEAAARAGVRHVVKLSSIGADEEPQAARIIRAHREVERAIEATGMGWTHLRPHWFLQNELGQAGSIVRDGVFFAPDVGTFSPIDARDVAAVAARVLTEDGHAGRAYVLTGPRAVTYAGLAEAYATALGRPVRWAPVSLADAHASMVDAGVPDALAAGFTEIMARYREGGVTAAVSPEVERLLGRPARDPAAFAADHLLTSAGARAA